MHRARAFFFVAAGIFLLALSYHLGARNAVAQAPANPVVAVNSSTAYVYTANGDVYRQLVDGTWVWHSNVFGSTPVTRESFGSMKSRYRGAAQPTTQDR